MKKEDILKLFNEFIIDYNAEEKDVIWQENSTKFRNFWNNRILADDKNEINDAEADEIIRILDRNGRGNTKNSEAVARAMIAQGAWRRMFNEIKSKKELSQTLNKIFLEKDLEKKIYFLDELYKLNEKNKNNLTGQSANAINCMLFAFDPPSHISVISLNDRKKIIDFFELDNAFDFDKNSIGKKIVFSNQIIINGFRKIGIIASPRTISSFLYSDLIKFHWKIDQEVDSTTWVVPKDQKVLKEDVASDLSLFYMESQLEDFLIENWDKTELSHKYDLIEEDGELKSQQYKTDIGRIDILAQDKSTKQYVVIELKKNQTSDDTIGQLTRYMGWLEEHKTNGKATKGIIIAAQYDDRLHYALKKVEGVEVYLYRVDFKLQEFKK